jgi:HEAT repeat protein
MRIGSAEAARLLQALLRPPSLVERLRGDRGRRDALRALAASAEPAAIPAILPFTTVDSSLALDAGRAIVELWRHTTVTDLLWLDEAVRNTGEWGWGAGHAAWRPLSPRQIPTLAERHGGNPIIMGLLASHANGYVREAAVEMLGGVTGGREIPFLALRANDWVGPVAERAARLLVARLTPDNRDRVVALFPLLMRALDRRRRDHAVLAEAIHHTLRSDDGIALLAALPGFDRALRRAAFAALAPADGPVVGEVVRAALGDADAIVRRRAVSWLARDEGPLAVAGLERLAEEDPDPHVRAAALDVVAARAPMRARSLVNDALLDRSATVRGLARYLAGKLAPDVAPRGVYVVALNGDVPRQAAAAVEGLGETGSEADAPLVRPFLTHAVPRIRRAALVALATLAPVVAVAAAMDALDDLAPAVRRAARDVVRRHRRQVDFETLWTRIRALVDAQLRCVTLKLLIEAPRWDAVAFLLMALDDADAHVRASALALVDEWARAFNQTYALMPTRAQRERVRALSERHRAQLPGDTLRALDL